MRVRTNTVSPGAQRALDSTRGGHTATIAVGRKSNKAVVYDGLNYIAHCFLICNEHMTLVLVGH